MIKPWPLPRNRHLGDDQFRRDDFIVDYTTRTVTCLDSITVTIGGSGAAVFKAKCRGCPLRSRCTAAVDGEIIHVGVPPAHTAFASKHSQGHRGVRFGGADRAPG